MNSCCFGQSCCFWPRDCSGGFGPWECWAKGVWGASKDIVSLNVYD